MPNYTNGEFKSTTSTFVKSHFWLTHSKRKSQLSVASHTRSRTVIRCRLIYQSVKKILKKTVKISTKRIKIGGLSQEVFKISRSLCINYRVKLSERFPFQVVRPGGRLVYKGVSYKWAPVREVKLSAPWKLLFLSFTPTGLSYQSYDHQLNVKRRNFNCMDGKYDAFHDLLLLLSKNLQFIILIYHYYKYYSTEISILHQSGLYTCAITHQSSHLPDLAITISPAKEESSHFSLLWQHPIILALSLYAERWIHHTVARDERSLDLQRLCCFEMTTLHH